MPDLNRRGFLRFMGIAATAAALPPIAKPDANPEAIARIQGLAVEGRPFGLKGWGVNVSTKEIFAQPDAETVSVEQLYRALTDIFDDEDMLAYEDPMIRVTPEIVEMRNDWRIGDEGFKHLYGGSVTQGDEIYATIRVLGEVDVPSPTARIECNEVTEFASPTFETNQWYDEVLKIPRDAEWLTFQDHKHLGRPWGVQLTSAYPGVICIPNPIYNLHEVPARKLARAYGSDWRMFGEQPVVERARRSNRERWRPGRGWS